MDRQGLWESSPAGLLLYIIYILDFFPGGRIRRLVDLTSSRSNSPFPPLLHLAPDEFTLTVLRNSPTRHLIHETRLSSANDGDIRSNATHDIRQNEEMNSSSPIKLRFQAAAPSSLDNMTVPQPNGVRAAGRRGDCTAQYLRSMPGMNAVQLSTMASAPTRHDARTDRLRLIGISSWTSMCERYGTVACRGTRQDRQLQHFSPDVTHLPGPCSSFEVLQHPPGSTSTHDRRDTYLEDLGLPVRDGKALLVPLVIFRLGRRSPTSPVKSAEQHLVCSQRSLDRGPPPRDLRTALGVLPRKRSGASLHQAHIPNHADAWCSDLDHRHGSWIVGKKKSLPSLSTPGCSQR
nr:hypothetical protein CFP56_07468 [Quercus suber]